ncbi:signal peptidase II [Paenibacillus ginsengihumi]|uniref:signal peptidase II n=1 Tax=Paenibacillus ginsengihumi TaxID=431596 RepID=UPI00047702F3|nr:signal peptidase II [Paenibacillus ginsengihumi]
MIYYIYAAIVVLIDQATKRIVVNRMELYESIPVIGEFFQITSHRNKGAAFGILQNQRWFFIIVTLFVVVGVIWYLSKMVKERRKLLPVALSLVLGGAIGNFIDRLLFGEVVDFFHFTFRFPWFGREIEYQYPIFNIADSAIVIGVGLILLDSLLSWKEEAKAAKAAKTAESGESQ